MLTLQWQWTSAADATVHELLDTIFKICYTEWNVKNVTNDHAHCATLGPCLLSSDMFSNLFATIH